eukprot:Lankesteria_metandrocarpae@DN1351_c0_g1_i1.p1
MSLSTHICLASTKLCFASPFRPSKFLARLHNSRAASHATSAKRTFQFGHQRPLCAWTGNSTQLMGSIGVPRVCLSTAPSMECSKIDQRSVLTKCNALKDSIIACNWSDTYKLVENIPFWEAAMSVIEEKALILDDHIEAGLLKEVKGLQKLLDCLYIVEDVRDHINELHMHLDRATGIAGTGVHAHPTVENIDEHLKHLTSSYESIRQKYKKEPVLLLKVDEVLGGGLAILRQKKRFDFSTQNRFYY